MRKFVIIFVLLSSTLFAFLISQAEIKISPDGVTTSDNNAVLTFKEAANSGDHEHDPSEAVVIGENIYSGLYKSSGGYFSAKGSYGSGVFGTSSGTFGKGFEGEASGSYGTGVRGRATGSSGKGVFGWASYTGTAQGAYGGYFRADANASKGVYGIGNGVIGFGVYGESTADQATGVKGVATGTAGKGVYGEATYGGSGSGFNVYGGYFNANNYYSGIGVRSSGKWWDFYAAAGGGGEYGPFTGAHEVKFAEDMPGEILPGLIVSVTGRVETRKDKDGGISLSSTLPTVSLSKKEKDKSVLGVLVSEGSLPEEHWCDTKEGERFGVVNALGEGRVWVTNRNGNIGAGDYITTSVIPGYGQMQDDDFLRSYTLGKAIETVDWERVTEIVEHDGQSYQRYLIAIVYTSG